MCDVGLMVGELKVRVGEVEFQVWLLTSPLKSGVFIFSNSF